MRRKLSFYFSAEQKKLEMECEGKTLFKGQEYTECRTCESEHYSAGLLKPHNERFPDSVFLGTGYGEDIKVIP